MRTLSVRRFFSLFFIAALTACGGSGDDSGSSAPTPPVAPPPAPTAKQGAFIDAAVQGLGFTSGTFTGRTDANGRFDYRAGETVTFTLGRTTLGGVPGTDVITPLTLAGTSDETDQRVINIIRLLQSLDADGNPENGIVLDEPAQTAADLFGPLNFNQSTAAFALDPNVLALLRQARGATATLVTTERALGHLRDATFRYRYPGIWHVTFSGGSGDFAIDNEGRVRGSAVYQGGAYPLMGYVAGNGGVAIYASDPAHPATQQYPTVIFTVARFEGKLVDSGTARGTSIILQPSGATVSGAWSAQRVMPTFDLGIRADLAVIIERWHRTLPAAWRYTITTEERRSMTGELLSAWYLAQINTCNQRRIARGEAPTPPPPIDVLRVVDSQRFSGVYRQGRGVLRAAFTVVRFNLRSECEITLEPFEAQLWFSDTDDTIYDLPVDSPPRSFVRPTAPLPLPFIVPRDYAVAADILSGADGSIDQSPCLWSPNADGMRDGTRIAQGRVCTLSFDGLITSYLDVLQPRKSERSGYFDTARPDDISNTASTSVSISLQLNRTNQYIVRDDEVTPPRLRAR